MTRQSDACCQGICSAVTAQILRGLLRTRRGAGAASTLWRRGLHLRLVDCCSQEIKDWLRMDALLPAARQTK